jgi:hypothetical protein
MTSMIEPAKLSGLRQAVYVMNCLSEQHNETQIVNALNNDKQLFDMWKSFLKYNNWMTEQEEGWCITPKGAVWKTKVATA